MPASTDNCLTLITGAWDDLPALFTRMGLPFRDLGGRLAALEDPKALRGCRALYLACGADYDLSDEGAAAIRAFIAAGGGLYASDLAAAAIERIFPGKIRFAMCDYQSNNPVQVVDEGLKLLLGETISLHMDFNSSQGVVEHDLSVRVLIRGPRQEQEETLHPYLVTFTHGQGEVLYTVFHNANQMEKTEEMLLEYLLLRPMLLEERRQSLAALNAAKTGPQAAPVQVIAAAQPGQSTGRFALPLARPGTLRAALAWRCAAEKPATLGLQVYTPAGKLARYVSSDQSPLVIEAPAPVAGKWSVSVKGVLGGGEHIPFVLTV